MVNLLGFFKYFEDIYVMRRQYRHFNELLNVS